MTSIGIFLQLAGAVALLLFGLGLVRDGMVEAFGLRMKMILGVGTRTGPRAFVSGLVATLGLQSSTACALLTASFVDRGMIGNRMAQIVLLGANIGTALTAVIVSSQVDALSPALILLGYVLRRRKGPVQTGIGTALLGLGLMLVSLTLLDHATTPMRGSAELAAFLPLLDDAWPVALVFSAIVAMLCSSSLAGVLLIGSLALPIDLTVVLVLGANLGGAVSAVIASSGLGTAARRVTIGNLVVRATGCLLALPFAGGAAALLSG
ncbi:MAG TPA: Na/Pi symporter, partial [Paracoccus sp. (in: a-proteobacteria)]|uniref:Na/Pi cotransporter family protein n=1 Tax=Paracoccus sp. TaxID=267 RepID=UPI002B6B682A